MTLAPKRRATSRVNGKLRGFMGDHKAYIEANPSKRGLDQDETVSPVTKKKSTGRTIKRSSKGVEVVINKVSTRNKTINEDKNSKAPLNKDSKIKKNTGFSRESTDDTIDLGFNENSEKDKEIVGKAGLNSQVAFEKARQALHVSEVPNHLPGREKQLEDLTNRLKSALIDQEACCIYLSGVPGTGKTATVRASVQALRSQIKGKSRSKAKNIPEFVFEEINAMQLTEPPQLYVKLWELLGNKTLSPAHALNCLTKYFDSPSKTKSMKPCVVLVDELDLLMSKSQSVLYNLFEWPHKPNANLLLVCIANTMDLPERLLASKVSSRLGMTRLVFNPYSHSELMAIVKERLSKFKYFQEDAVEMCGRKVAAVSGDARRALDICRRAVEMVESIRSTTNSSAMITIQIVNQAISSMYRSPVIKFLTGCSQQQKIMLIALLITVKSSGLDECLISDIITSHLKLCQFNNWPKLNPSHQLKVIGSLVSFNILLADHQSNNSLEVLGIGDKVTLNIPNQDIVMALKLESEFKNLL